MLQKPSVYEQSSYNYINENWQVLGPKGTHKLRNEKSSNQESHLKEHIVSAKECSYLKETCSK